MRPNQGFGIVALIVAAVGLYAGVCVVLSVVRSQMAVNDAKIVSRDLGAELAVAQRSSDAEIQRTYVLANANRQNKEGEAALTESRGRAAQAYAVATKTVEEAYTVRDERESKKAGYALLAVRDILDVLNIGTGGAVVICLVVPILLTVLATLRFSRRY